MNINAQELMLINKNMKFGETKPTTQPASPVTEPPVTKPESGLNALEAQANNNIAFQGTSNAAKTLLAKLRGKTAPYIMAGLMTAAPLAMAPMMTSCVETVSQSFVDLSPLFQYLQQQNDKLDAILKELQLSREIQEASLAIQTENNTILKNMYETEQLTLAEVQKISGILTDGIADITKTLTAQGATQEQILAAITGFRADANAHLDQLQKGLISLEEYIKLMNASIEEAKQILNDILAEVKGISEKITNNHNEYIMLEKEKLDMLTKIYEQGKMNTSLLEENNKHTYKLVELVANLNAGMDELKNIFNDEERYAKFMNDLEAIMPDDINYEKFEAMFNMLGLTIEDVINMSNEKVVALIQEFQTNYLANEAKQAEILDQINSKLDILKEIPNLNLAGVQEAIDKLTEAYLNGNGDLTALLKDVVTQMNEVIARLDKIVDNTSVLPEFYNKAQEFFTNALGNLEKGNQILEEIRKEQKVTNKKLDAFKDEFAGMREEQKATNSYLYILTGKMGDLEKAIKELDATGGAGMTRDEFIEAMEKIDARRAEEFKQFLKEYGFDKVPGNIQKIKELLDNINNAIANQKDYSGQLDKIIALENAILAFLQNADFTDPAVLEKLDTIIEKLNNFKCECECGNNTGSSNESVEDLEDLFGKN